MEFDESMDDGHADLPILFANTHVDRNNYLGLLQLPHQIQCPPSNETACTQSLHPDIPMMSGDLPFSRSDGGAKIVM
jgi:hypothetical protein